MKVILEAWNAFLDEAKEDDIKEKYELEDGEFHGETYAHFAYNQIVMWVNRDRSKRIKLLDWMAKQIAGSAWNSQKAMLKVFRMSNMAEKFLKLQSQFKEKDINNYPDIEALETAHKTEILDKIVAKNRERRGELAPEDGDIILVDDRFYVTHPKTTKGSCQLGAGTKWCISQRDNEHYDEYTAAGKIFYMIRDDTKKNKHDFSALTVQYNKYTGKREMLWDRYDKNYGPEDWPVDAYGEESEERIMGAIQKHFDDNYKGAERTLESLHREINNEAFDVTEEISEFLSYDVLFDSRLFDIGAGQQDLRFQAEYYVYYTPSPSIEDQFKNVGVEPEMIFRIFEKRKKQLIKGIFDEAPMQNIDVELVLGNNQINISAETKFNSKDVGQAYQWITAARNWAEGNTMDLTDAFKKSWNIHIMDYIKNGFTEKSNRKLSFPKRIGINEGVKRTIKVKIK